MPTSPLKVKIAKGKDADKAISLHEEAALWMSNEGINQWPYPSPQRYKNLIKRESAKGNVYLAWTIADSEPIGTFRLEWAPNELWMERPDGAAYLYSLSIVRTVKGQGIGVAIVQWIENFVKQQSVAFLRLDCMATNAVLRRYYERLGFTLVGETAGGEYSAALYEKKLL